MSDDRADDALLGASHDLTITGRGAASWGECSCGIWSASPGLTLAPPRTAITRAHTAHLEAVARARWLAAGRR